MRGGISIKLMAFEWESFSQMDLELSLVEYGIELGRFMYQFDILQEDEYFVRHFSRILKEGEYQGVISWNFWPLVAEVCFRLEIPYIAWVYDCPIAYDIVKWAKYPTSFIFIFDRVEYEKYKLLGVPHVYHHQLAVNIKRLEGLNLNDNDIEKYESEVSFLGSMYDSLYENLADTFTPYEKGYMDAVIRSQQSIYGMSVVEKSFHNEYLANIKTHLEADGVIESCGQDEFDEWFFRFVLRCVSRKDRIMLLSRLGKQFRTKYFSYREYPEIDYAQYSGPLLYDEAMFKMFKASKINLNITSRQITSGISLRALDIMGAGGFLLSNWQEELMENFTPGVDFVYYDSIEDALEKCRYYIEHEDERRTIARNGHNAVRKFEYQVQIKRIMDLVFGKQAG